ncbi:MAG TPA: YIP1 family protein [Nitrospiria bacterium]
MKGSRGTRTIESHPPVIKNRYAASMMENPGFSFGQFFNRTLRAAKLDPALYEEVERDTGALGQAIGMVVLSSLAFGIGTIGEYHGYSHVIPGMLKALVLWVLWAALTYLVGTRILPEPQTRADIGELLRTTGFSTAPGLLCVLGILPGLMGLTYLVASLWILVAMVIAIRQALDYQTTWRAVLVCGVGFLIPFIVQFVWVTAAAA